MSVCLTNMFTIMYSQVMPFYELSVNSIKHPSISLRYIITPLVSMKMNFTGEAHYYYSQARSEQVIAWIINLDTNPLQEYE